MAPQISLIDFSGFYSQDPAAKQKIVDQVRQSCSYNGFFQVINHGVTADQSRTAMNLAKKFFDLPQESKDKVRKENNTWNRGYEMMRSQILEAGTNPELKEGFYIGDEIPESHPYFVHKKLNSGPNQWPQDMQDMSPQEFSQTAMEYYHAVLKLASDLLKVLALSLDLDEDYFVQFMDGAVATMRLLHYPTQPKDADDKLTRGIGAHTDFGAITILLQDEVDGLQVWDANSGGWIDVRAGCRSNRGAFVVTLGNLMQRWTNEKYKSNIHRVINKSGRERYSIPFFVSGNPDYVVDCILTCKAAEEETKFPPITVERAVMAGYAESYGRAQMYKQGLAEAGQEALSAKSVPVVTSSA
ncbi:2OG-Fe(II) oxygenase superfamily protein [Microdochium trichocladiopsis]|uniref:2OG-Fe(II) oxygenase superfamily protein n=1 Tax=Microdochium trichocladiopsis TaxID=1682393 RepID=A0A9P9BJZ1_9PEZI|nr:2OG-Fe(II) oxygenase superfamily protein [Microdochium trichocladiopsis]KAH7020699.1 2OG-Fe(II) oxygenase superfamily protein [Microdochium trichocladiopsis]